MCGKTTQTIRKMAGVETTFETKPLLNQVRLRNSWKPLTPPTTAVSNVVTMNFSREKMVCLKSGFVTKMVLLKNKFVSKVVLFKNKLCFKSGVVSNVVLFQKWLCYKNGFV